MVYSRDCIASVSLGLSLFSIARPLHTHLVMVWEMVFSPFDGWLSFYGRRYKRVEAPL